jgi:acyl-CoA thioesterase
MDSQALLKFGRSVLLSQPFSQLIGAQLDSVLIGAVELSLPIRPDLMQQHGYLHGGVVSYLADNALTFAGGTVLGDAVTLEYKINYVRPAKGVRLIAKARVTHSGKTQAVCQCDVFAVDENQVETLCAIAQGTIWRKD